LKKAVFPAAGGFAKKPNSVHQLAVAESANQWIKIREQLKAVTPDQTVI
jgi:hypothetical protein